MYVKYTLNPIERKASATCTREIIQVDINSKNAVHLKFLLIYKNTRITAADELYTMLEEMLLSQHECVIMGDFNLPNIDWTLQKPTPTPDNKLIIKPENNRQNRRPSRNSFSIKTENGNIVLEKNNYNFRKANFNAMRSELNYQTFEQPIVINNAELGFGILKNRVNDASRRHVPKRRATINNPSWINNDVKQAIGRRQRAYETKGRINNEENIVEFIAAWREVKIILKQEKLNKE